MSVFPSSSSGPTCGCLGCHEDAAAVIQHPTHGERVVCDYHSTGHPVVRRCSE